MKVIVLQHAAWEDLGLFAEVLGEHEADVKVVRLYRDEPIPFPALRRGQYSCAICLGSPATAYLPETNPRHSEEVAFFRLLRQKRIPSFNICYSMQLFSVALGGRVERNPRGKEVGIHEVRLTPEGKKDAVFGFAAPAFKTLQWHGDHVAKLPRGSRRLASSRKTKNQIAVMDGVHYLVQGDGQAAYPSKVRLWLRKDRAWATEGTGLNEEELLRELEANRRYFREVYRKVLGNFLGLCCEELKRGV